MQLKPILVYFLFFISQQIYSQEKFYISFTIPTNLTENANAVIRSNEQIITMNAVDDMTVYERRIITVLNKEGNDDINAFVYYDNNVKIKTLEAIIYNQIGATIKKIKKQILKM